MKNKKFWQFRNSAENPKIGELMLYGIISSESWWGDEITPKQFKRDLDALGEIDELHIFINSDGGDIFAGQAIHSMLKRHNSVKVGHVDGLAASIASVILMACDKVLMPRNSMLMIHNPIIVLWGWYYAVDLEKMAADLVAIKEPIISVYEDKSGLSRDEISAIMDAETWMTAEEAVELGFADEIEEAKKIAASVSGGAFKINGQEMDLGRFRNLPKALKMLNESEPDPPDPEPDPEPDPNNLKDKQTEVDGLLSSYQAMVQVNQNRFRRNAN